MEYCIFSKHFQTMEAEELGKTLAKLGADGVDLTTRESGHIQPAQVKDELPRFQEVLAKEGIKISLLTTTIVEMNQQAQDIVETASKLDIKYLKLGYWQYKGFGHYEEQAKEVKKALAGLEPLFRDNGVKAGFHTHSDMFMGLNANHVLRLIEDCDPEAIGVYYDVGHSTIEGSASGWMMDLDLVRERLFMIAVKDMAWFRLGGQNEAKKGWVRKMVPLEAGLTDWPKFVECLKQMKFAGPISFHSEYQGSHSWRDLNSEEVVEQTGRDLSYFRSLMEE